ncbi:MAG: cytochrome c [Saprospiraceae bacterium]|nr:cytochrome c [Bacteroidia bacterium]MBT8229064.1 cytochrome c [Bacteroidia bacterium]NNF23139.1 cytochrome c [Saprospiraceae bacterium]NNK90443.1 cytochrome c [Saprospiraceae bacterium]
MIKRLIVLVGLIAFISACKTGTSSYIDAEKLFKINCVICHGVDGKLGINGAKDLTASPMTLDERINNITNGAGTMTPFKGILSEEEIKAVAAYTFKLKK